jgi:hypothetical protein
MDVVERVATGADPTELADLVVDLGTYPGWLGLVVAADPDPDAPADAPAWSVELRAQVGPLARSKRLRMVRDAHVPGTSARFVRAETDGRDHSAWVLEATVAPLDTGSELTMHLHYGGRMFGAVLERILRDEIRRARASLEQRYPS